MGREIEAICKGWVVLDRVMGSLRPDVSRIRVMMAQDSVL
jgi:hypothetical protein